MFSERLTKLILKFAGRDIFSFAVVLMFFCAIPSNAAILDEHELGYNGGANSHPHNLSNLNNGLGTISALPTETDQICIFCHTPHSASSEGPLWNRTDNISPVGGGAFPLYGRLSDIAIDDAASGAEYGTGIYPNGSSRLCLSCHDGVTAVGQVVNGGWSGPGIAPSLGSLTALGSTAVIDLSTSHPISFIYNDSVKTFIESPAQQNQPGQYLVPDQALGYLDSESRMQCATCHDPHIDTAGFGGYTLPMWRDFSALGSDDADYDKTCGACHVGGSNSPGLDSPHLPSAPGIHPIP